MGNDLVDLPSYESVYERLFELSSLHRIDVDLSSVRVSIRLRCHQSIIDLVFSSRGWFKSYFFSINELQATIGRLCIRLR